jgi:hypothetical protein
MDYYAKYIKYKAKYMNLRKQIEGGEVDAKCENDKKCNTKEEYCGRNLFGLKDYTCKAKKGSGSNCDRPEQCSSNVCQLKGKLDGTKKCT